MEYNLAFRKEATVSGLSDSSKMNLGVSLLFTNDLQHPLGTTFFSHSLPVPLEQLRKWRTCYFFFAIHIGRSMPVAIWQMQVPQKCSNCDE